MLAGRRSHRRHGCRGNYLFTTQVNAEQTSTVDQVSAALAQSGGTERRR